jgi:hypothetical protein
MSVSIVRNAYWMAIGVLVGALANREWLIGNG